ncbi:nuclear transport factor 2 family protein [uncultured Ilumatobacter sp.]|jgi:ketosteroid isomerase-like protein|uniref:nuclear transport factor 2 family protein n=1 Tax=uncultured Ilumatobacter sp. TaxID=879968 RepID=UPI00374F5E8B
MNHSADQTADSTDTAGNRAPLPARRLDLPDAASRELIEAFAVAVSSGDARGLHALLGEQVIYQLPGRSADAGLHRGREQVAAALTQPVAPGATVDRVDVTETMNDGNRGLAIIYLQGESKDGPFAVEVAFHLQTDAESIIGITEYSGDQYLVDSLLVGSDPAPQREWLRRLRRWPGRRR